MSDLIKRADAIEAVEAVRELLSVEAHCAITERISALPSAEAVQGWIPCSERLPDVGRAVLASGYYNDVYIATLKEDKREEYYWSAFGGFPVMFSAVDAWMPLPKPYKGGENE